MTKPGGRKVGGTVLILAGLAAALLFSSCGASPAAARRELPALVISEVVSSNRESLPVDALGAPDWIELQNIGDTALELEGYGLSDRTTEPGKYIFGKETLEPGQTIVVYAKQVESLHAPFARRCTGFALSKDGETLCLTAPDRTTIQTLTLPALPRTFRMRERPTATTGTAACRRPESRTTTQRSFRRLTRQSA